MLAMRIVGPSFVETFEYASEHYIVRSDIDKKVCLDASRVLEASLKMFASELGEVPAAAALEKFQVYIFRGQSGYDRYTRRILGERVPHTAGLYSPSLKQLLIWNLPSRENMFVTVRHEGFHQYLHALLGTDVPVWLNEGMAEYYERAQRRIGGVKAAKRHAVHLQTLAKLERVSLERFVGITRRAFYSRAQLHYAEAWALVRLLRDPKAGYRPVFDKLIAELKAGKTGAQAVETAFAGVDFLKMEEKFAASLRW